MKTWESKTVKYNSGCGRLYVTIDANEFGKPIHCFVQSINGCPTTMNTIGRYISNDLEDGDKTIERIVKPLKKTVCAACVNNPNADGKSCCELIARALLNFDKPDTKQPIKRLQSPF